MFNAIRIVDLSNKHTFLQQIKIANLLSNPMYLTIFTVLAVPFPRESAEKPLYWTVNNISYITGIDPVIIRRFLAALAMAVYPPILSVRNISVPKYASSNDLLLDIFDTKIKTVNKRGYAVIPQQLLFNLVSSDQISEIQTISFNLHINSSPAEFLAVAKVFNVIRRKPLYKFIQYMQDMSYTAPELVDLAKQNGNILRVKAFHDSLLPAISQVPPSDCVLLHTITTQLSGKKGRPALHRFKRQYSRIRLQFIDDPFISFDLVEMPDYYCIHAID